MLGRPPGTGKTKTILGLVGAFISNRGRRATGISVGGGSSNGYQAPAEKLLLCAPSNAAVDEVAKRLKDGVYDSEGKRFVPKIVRIGQEHSMNNAVSDLSLDSQVEKLLGGQTMSSEALANMNAARAEMTKLRGERSDKQQEKQAIVNNTAALAHLSTEISQLSRRINDLSEKFDREKDRHQQSNRAAEAARRKARADVLTEADIICSTLSGSGHEYLATFDFETVIIDEAAQSVEISSLIPLRYNCQRCIMVGGALHCHSNISL